jgi:hypothetical protein
MTVASGIAIAGAGFLAAILWMDLMFDVQVLRHRRPDGELPEDVLASIAAYYRRVTTEASPMGHLIGVVMGITLFALALENLRAPGGITVVSIPLLAGPIVLAALRIVPNAARLGARLDSTSQQAALARGICRDHLLCLAGVLAFLALQLATAPR